VTELLAALDVLPLDRAAAEAAGEVRRELEGTGAGIGMADAGIAGACRASEPSC
jgi:predicted nucleic acid-binding protein